MHRAVHNSGNWWRNRSHRWMRLWNQKNVAEPLALTVREGIELLLHRHFGGGVEGPEQLILVRALRLFCPARLTPATADSALPRSSGKTPRCALRRGPRRAAAGAQGDLAADGARPRARAPDRRGDPGQQPPQLRRLGGDPERGAAQGRLPRQVRLLHRHRPQGARLPGLVRGARDAAGRPRRHQGRDRQPRHRPRRARPGRGVRDLPRGHPVARRPPLPRPHRRRPPRADRRRTRRARGADRNPGGPAGRLQPAADRADHRGVRRADRLHRPLRGRSVRPGAPGRHRRGDGRDPAELTGQVEAGIYNERPID